MAACSRSRSKPGRFKEVAAVAIISIDMGIGQLPIRMAGHFGLQLFNLLLNGLSLLLALGR